MRWIATWLMAMVLVVPAWATDLTPAQLQTLKADINAKYAAQWAAQDIAGIAAAYNTPTTFVVWRTSVPVDEINDAIVWSNLTPADAVPTSDVLAAAVWQNRSDVCQGKQFNLQLIFAQRGAIPGTKSNIRAGLQDALTNIPSGANGALQTAGWAQVRLVLQRVVNAGERLYATGTGTQATPGTVVVEGTWDESTIVEATGQ